MDMNVLSCSILLYILIILITDGNLNGTQHEHVNNYQIKKRQTVMMILIGICRSVQKVRKILKR